MILCDCERAYRTIGLDSRECDCQPDRHVALTLWLPPHLHSRMATEAAQAGVSMQEYILNKIKAKIATGLEP